MIPVRALTSKAPGRANVVTSDVEISTPTADTVHPKATQKVTAIWDTGATGTVITAALAGALGILPSGMVKKNTANGEMDSNVYLVDVLLPLGVGFPNMTVTEGTVAGADVLIGMDIICQGDFSITNFGDKTTASYRIPSIAEVDYVKEAPDGFLPQTNPERVRLKRTGHLFPLASPRHQQSLVMPGPSSGIPPHH